MHKIYCVNSAGHDFTPALKYIPHSSNKNLIHLTDGKVNIFNLDRLKRELELKLKNFDEQDFLLLCGNTTLCSLTVHILSKKVDKIPLLIYNAKTKEYVLREM